MDRNIRNQVILFTATRLVLDTSMRMVYPFIVVISRGLGVSVQQMSIAFGWRWVAGAICPLLASIGDQRGRKVIIVSGLVLYIVGLAWIVFSPNFSGFFISLLLTTSGVSIFNPGVQAYLGDKVPYNRRGLALSVLELAWALSFGVGIPILGFIIARAGWMAPYPLFLFLSAIALFVIMRSIPTDFSAAKVKGTIFNNFGLAFSSKAVLAGLFVSLVIQACHEMVSIVYGLWMEDVFHLQITALGTAAIVIGIAEFFGEGVVGVISDRIGLKRSVGIGLFGMAAALAVMPFFRFTLMGALAGMFLFFLALEFAYVSSVPLLTEVLPAARVTLMALAVTFAYLGRAILSPMTPWLYEHGLWFVSMTGIVLCISGMLALVEVRISAGVGSDVDDER
jgi:predicted MFS family arabinose efflux permease